MCITGCAKHLKHNNRFTNIEGAKEFDLKESFVKSCMLEGLRSFRDERKLETKERRKRYKKTPPLRRSAES